MIAHITATFPPYWAGTGNVVYHNARVLHERGHDVAVFTAQTPGAVPPFSFAVHRLPTLFRLGNAPCTPALIRRLRGARLIHLHYPYIFGAELALLASSLYRIPLVLTYHNRLLETHPLKRLLFDLYNLSAEPLLLRRVHKLLAVSSDHFAALHPRIAHVTELSNGVDTTLFSPRDGSKTRAELGLSASAPLALFVGALDRAHRFKNLSGLLNAFAAPPLQAAQLLVVGDGDQRVTFEKLSAQLGLNRRVHFLGSRSPQDLPALYSAADVTVLPSTGVESFGLVLLESLACGTTVIASDLPGVRTLVGDVGGQLVPPHDAAALIGALAKVLSSRQLAAQQGRAGRRRVVANYDWQVVGDRLEHVYQEVLGA